MPKYLYLTSHRAHLFITAGGDHMTWILFSIDDRKRIAWYSFYEHDQAFSAGIDRDLMTGNNDESTFILGQPTKSTPFQPLVPRKVDQFAESGGTRARAFVKHHSNKFSYEIKVFLKSGSEFLNCEFRSNDPPIGVAEREKGVVKLLRIEKYSGSRISSPARSLVLMHGKKTDDPVLITDDE